MRPEIYKIHHINSNFNRFFSPLIYLFSLATVLLMAILPYHGRLLLALLINIFFNRPMVYINIISRKISYPLHKINVFLLYSIFIGIFALFYRVFVRNRHVGFIKVAPDFNTDKLSSRFQS